MPCLLFTSYQIMSPLRSLPLQMAERLLRAPPDSVADHVKARQSLIERSELIEILLMYVWRIFVYYKNVPIKLIFDYEIFGHIGLFYILDTSIGIRHAVTWLAVESGWAWSKRSAICSGKLCGGFIIFEQCRPVKCEVKCHYNCRDRPVLIRCKLVLFTNIKWHTGFSLVPKSVTLYDFERRNGRRPALSLRQLNFLFAFERALYRSII